MTITSNDIKLFQAQDNTDNDSGGGSRTSTEIVDGDVNNLFPDISRIDTVSGDVALRKIFPTVTTSNRDVYYGAHTMIRKPPTDPKVSALIFHTDDPYDTRIEAQDKIESYVVASYKEEFYLYGNHVKGAKSVTFLQTITSQTPDVGEVYLLKDGVDEQYIRIASIDVQEVILSYSFGSTPIDYTRRRIICEIDQALDFAFVGSAFHPTGQLANTADTWATQVADAAKFYATKSLSENAEEDDLTITVDDIFEQLVPASKKQTPLINKTALVQGSSLLATGNIITEVIPISTYGAMGQLPNAIIPNSFKLITSYIDDGLGNIIHKTTSAVVGSVDYKLGSFTQSAITGGVSTTYEVANVFNSNIQFTGEIKITQENVGNVFIQRLSPLPSIGDLYIDYRSNGKWYRFASTGNRDSGNETLGGAAGIGSGALNDNTDGTGTVSMTLASLPDIDSSVIISWGSSERISKRTTLVAGETEAYMSIPLGQVNLNPLSFVMQVYSPSYGTYKNVTALADGTLVDELNKITGTLDFINGEALINGTSNTVNRFATLNHTDSLIIDFDYSTAGIGEDGEVKTVKASPSASTGIVAFTAQNAVAGTLSFEIGEAVNRAGIKVYLLITVGERNRPVALICDAAGSLKALGTSTWNWGTISPTGTVSLSIPTYAIKEANPGYTGSYSLAPRYITTPHKPLPVLMPTGEHVLVEYQSESPLSYSQTHNITGKYENLVSYKIKTLPNIVGEVSMDFPKVSSKLHSSNGLMFNASNVQIGTIDNATGEIELTCFDRPDVFSIAFTKLFTDEIGEDADTVLNYTFRTAATKLTTSSFQFYYETANGIYIATSDGNGVVTGADIDSLESYVDTKTGMANIVFTAPATPSSFKYDAVAESSLPLDPELLGLNPVRLPADGRVPVFKSGYHLIIFNEVTTATTNTTPLANDVDTLARSGQAYIEVIDANGKRLDPVQYIADRDLGTITFSPTLVLEDKYNVALVAPFSIVDRVEDMLLATDVQVNGLITLSAGLSRDYALGVTKVASSLVWGDTGARVYNLFSQEVWDSGNPTWSDTRIGDNTTAQYDNINSPIQIDNKSSSAGRWAMIFKSSTVVDVVHEKLGVVLSSVVITTTDVEPINPATGLPYFTMLKGGFGGGWVTNNVIRLNTDSGDVNAWVIRTVQSGALSELTDSIDIEVRGDAN